MPRRYIAAPAKRPAQTLSCVVEATLAERVRDMARLQQRTVSFLVGQLLHEALERRGDDQAQTPEKAQETIQETTHASA